MYMYKSRSNLERAVVEYVKMIVIGHTHVCFSSWGVKNAPCVPDFIGRVLQKQAREQKRPDNKVR